MTYAILFPGQGSQTVGMGADSFEAHAELLGDIADSILGWSLRTLCLEGPADELTRTEHAQPALFAVSYALWLSFRDAVRKIPAAAAGHSLGEYTALTAAGALSFEQALSLVAGRGKTMANAADLEPSGMAALIGADVDLAEKVVRENQGRGGRLQLANSNAPGQVVVAGSAADLEWLEEHGKDLGVRRVITLNVAGAFHSSFMSQAADELATATADVSFAEPEFEVISNVSARPHESGSIGAKLVEQVTSPVRFEESLRNMAASGIGTFVHIGPGDVTAGLAKRTIPEANVFTVSSLDDIDSAVESLSTMDHQ